MNENPLSISQAEIDAAIRSARDLERLTGKKAASVKITKSRTTTTVTEKP